jgi:uncharacterized protein (TIGR03000 family)
MRNHDPTTGRRWQKGVGAALVLLGLAGVGLQEGWAQMYYNGGFVHVHRRPNQDVPRIAGLSNAPPAKTASPEPTTISPDNDYRYRSNSFARDPGRTFSFPAGGLSSNIAAALLPWNQAGFKEYDEALSPVLDSPPTAPGKYSLEITPLPSHPAAGRAETATLIVHLPERARLWVDGRRTSLKGSTSYFQSPALTPGKKYHYTVRVDWSEDGGWVSQTLQVPVEAGLAQAIYIQQAAPALKK